MWFLEENFKKNIEAAVSDGYAPTAEQKQEFAGYQAAAQVTVTHLRTASINIEGVLTQKPDIFAMIFGGGNTTYPEISEAVLKAEANARVDNIQLNIDSPGGEVSGLFKLLETLDGIKKPITAKVSGMAASAAYAIAVKADRIIAESRGSRVGSIGTTVSIPVDVDTVNITSSNAPDKRPDVTTEAGKAVVRRELDAAEELFIEVVAAGRGVTADAVKQNFGRGAVFFADEAKNRGMIDEIATATVAGRKIVDLETLKTEHPGVYAAAVELGVEKERDRVVAHLTLGDKSGDMQTAIEAISSGAGMTLALQAKYMSAGINNADMAKRVADNSDVTATVAAAVKSPRDLVLEEMNKLTGVANG